MNLNRSVKSIKEMKENEINVQMKIRECFERRMRNYSSQNIHLCVHFCGCSKR